LSSEGNDSPGVAEGRRSAEFVSRSAGGRRQVLGDVPGGDAADPSAEAPLSPGHLGARGQGGASAGAERRDDLLVSGPQAALQVEKEVRPSVDINRYY
jgi:hypothetical protein